MSAHSLTPVRPTHDRHATSAGTPGTTPLAPAEPARRASERGRWRATPRARRLFRIGRAIGVPLLLAGLVTAGSPGWGLYTIHQGDTLSAIAARYHTTVARLVQANNLPGNGNLIIAGSTLKVPSGAATHSTATGARAFHRVVTGDTLSGIALRYGVSQASIARANHLASSNVVRLGETLVIPGGHHATARTSSSANSFAGRTYSSAVVGAAAHNRALMAHRRLPSTSQMRDIIAAKARANGVDPALALAVAYQESGWNQRVVSVANAVGAMQVIPATSAWISGVVGRRLDPTDPHDNATTGVVLLRFLTQTAKSDRQAVAGYYQGLKSVRAHGMFPDTRRYVDNVLALRARFR
jgi:LysM repeat protein